VLSGVFGHLVMGMRRGLALGLAEGQLLTPSHKWSHSDAGHRRLTTDKVGSKASPFRDSLEVVRRFNTGCRSPRLMALNPGQSRLASFRVKLDHLNPVVGTSSARSLSIPF
jgi:hypothetical protein